MNGGVRRVPLVAFVAAWAGVAAAGAADKLPVLTACVVADNPPFSGSAPEDAGFDADFAELIARQLGRDLRLQRIEVPARGGFGRALKDSVQGGKCDVLVGVPAGPDMAAELAEHRLASTRPYLTLGYLLVTAPGTRPAKLEDARRAERLGVCTATPADLYLFKEHFHRVPYGSNRDLLQALYKGEIGMALVWSPAIARVRADGTGAQPVVASEQPNEASLRTDLTLAVRRSDDALERDLDRAIERLQSEGDLERLAERYGLLRLSPG